MFEVAEYVHSWEALSVSCLCLSVGLSVGLSVTALIVHTQADFDETCNVRSYQYFRKVYLSDFENPALITVLSHVSHLVFFQ